jgi:hypothetical protein
MSTLIQAGSAQPTRAKTPHASDRMEQQSRMQGCGEGNFVQRCQNPRSRVRSAGDVVITHAKTYLRAASFDFFSCLPMPS